MALATGASLVFAYAPFSLWYIVFPCLTLFLLPLRQLKAVPAFWHGLWFGLGYFGAGMSWVHISVYQFGDTGFVLSTIFTLGFVTLLAIFPALTAYVLQRFLFAVNQTVYYLLAWPLAWMLLEWLRSWIFTGLPWLNIGHSQINGPLASLYPLLGSDFVSLALLVWAGLLCLWMVSGKLLHRPVLYLILLLVALPAVSQQMRWVTPDGESLAVTLLQPKVAQDKKWELSYRYETMRYLYQQTEDLSDDLVIWPEAAIPALSDQVMDYLEAVNALAESQDQTILTGIPIRKQARFYNGIMLLGNDQGEYYKRHLVPFGEYVPFEEHLRGLIRFFDMPMSSFSKGAFEQPRLRVGEVQIALAICYEIIFQDLVAQQVEGADVLVTLSNDAWFGNSHGPYQHLELAQIRALENGIPVIRGTNDGVSAYIDAYGKIQKQLGKGLQGQLSHEVMLYQGTTPFRQLGPDVSRLLVFLILIILYLRFKNRDRETLTPTKILVVGPSWVGDMIMTQSLFMTLKERYPAAAIDVLAPDWTRPLLERMPEVRRAIAMPVGHGRLDLKARNKVAKSLSLESYSHCYLVPNSLKSAIIPWLAEIPQRIGWFKEPRFILVNDLRKLDKKAYPKMLQRLNALAYPAASSIPENLPYPKLAIADESVSNALSKHDLNSQQATLVLCPGAEFGASKRWPESHYADVAAYYLNKGWQVWLFGSEKDRTCCDAIATQAEGCINLAGKTTLAEAIDLMSRASLVVTNDSGLMHMAAALDRPLVAVYGSTSPEFTPPLNQSARIVRLDLECSPCFKRDCPLGHNDCMQQLDSSRVIVTLEQLETEITPLNGHSEAEHI